VGRPKAQGTLFGKRLERLKIIKEIYGRAATEVTLTILAAISHSNPERRRSMQKKLTITVDEEVYQWLQK